MTEERITTIETPEGNTHTTHTTVVSDEPRSGGAGKWVLILIVLALAVLAAIAFMQMSGAEVAKDNAIGDAADQVGEAAGTVGQTAQDLGEAAKEAVN